MRPSQQLRIPTLDGWRGIAILLVLLDHFAPTAGTRFFGWTASLGQHGVTIFFVLSGFLITTTLLHERDLTGRISLRQFYLRRFFRLFPAAACYLGLIKILFGVTGLAACFLSYRNFVQGHPLTAHFWSLAIEDQFYLVWPLLVVFLAPARALWIALAGSVAVALCRAFLITPTMFRDYFPTFQTQFRADALLLGCALALLIRIPRVRDTLARVPLIPALLLLFACMWQYKELIPIWESALIAVILGTSSLLRPGKSLRIALEWPPLAWIGRISYSLYLWHALPATVDIHTTAHLAARIAGTFLLAITSYYIVEQPLRRTARPTRTAPQPASNLTTVVDAS